MATEIDLLAFKDSVLYSTMAFIVRNFAEGKLLGTTVNTKRIIILSPKKMAKS